MNKAENDIEQAKKKEEVRPESNVDSQNFIAKHQEEINNLSNTFISRLKTAREGKGLTQEELATQIGTSKPAIRKYEQGQSLSNSNFTLKTLATALGVSVDYLLDIKLNTDSSMDVFTKNFGLREEALNVLKSLHLNDGGEINHGNIDFLNCFLGNGDATMQFIEQYAKLTRQKYKSTTKYQRDDISYEMTKLMTAYMDTVVLPAYKELYETGTFTVHPLEYYLFEHDEDE